MTRKVFVRVPTPDILEKFPHARQVVARVSISEARRPEAKPRKNEVHYYIVTGKPGMRRLSPVVLTNIIRKHWGIENRLHHVLDRTLREDDQKTRVGGGPSVLSLLRKCAMALLRTNLPKKSKTAYLPEIQAGLLARPKKAISMLKRAKA